jgi:hypothetical protein
MNTYHVPSVSLHYTVEQLDPRSSITVQEPAECSNTGAVVIWPFESIFEFSRVL